MEIWNLEICLYNSMLIGSVCAPLRGEGRGRKEKGGGRKGPAPGGPLRAAHPLPSLLPPLGPRNPTGNPSLCFFSSFFFGSTCHQLRDCCLSTFYFLLSLSHVSLCNVLLLKKLQVVSARILKCSIIQGKSFWFWMKKPKRFCIRLWRMRRLCHFALRNGKWL